MESSNLTPENNYAKGASSVASYEFEMRERFVQEIEEERRLGFE